MIELKLKHYGYEQPEIKEERIVKIELPTSIVEEEYKRRREKKGELR